MNNKLTRRQALMLGTSAAFSLASPLPAAEQETVPTSPNPKPKPMSAPQDEICLMRAVDLVTAVRNKELSAREIMQAHLRQIRRINAKVNAIVTMVPEEELMRQAAAADESLAKGKWLGPLHGLPVIVKDLHETKGLLTTYGSPIYRDHIPDFDCRVVQREKAACAILLGKSILP